MDYKLGNIPELVQRYGKDDFLIDRHYPKIATGLWIFWGSKDFHYYIQEVFYGNMISYMPYDAMMELFEVQKIHDEVFPDIGKEYEKEILEKLRFSNKPNKKK